MNLVMVVQLLRKFLPDLEDVLQGFPNGKISMFRIIEVLCV
jgi:hypothetical protein